MSFAANQRRDQLRDLYGFDFPDDLFRFWEFAKRLNPLDPLHALSEPLGVVLVGPFDVLSSRFDKHSPPLSPLLHWRYYLDPPEFFTVLAGGGDGLHWGYYLDDPVCSVGCVASYYANDVFEMSVDGDDLFEAIRLFLEEHWDCGDLDHGFGLIGQDEYKTDQVLLAELREKLLACDAGKRTQTGAGYVDRYGGRCSRRRVVASTPEHMGVVAPLAMYRPPSLADRKLRALLRREDDPIAVVEEARQALRDRFPATALKVGKELWPLCDSAKKREYAYELLDAAYAALGRDTLRHVLRTHREHRDLPSVDIFDADADPRDGLV
jgi:hypothetical protein